jgi:ComF family protein
MAELPLMPICCQECALPLDFTGALCGDCLTQPKPYQSTHCALLYQNPTHYLIQQFKDAAAWQVGRCLCDLWLQQHGDQNLSPNTLVVPIPSHPSKCAARGYWPSYLIAQQLALHFGLKVQPLLQMQRRAVAQKTLNRQARLRNLLHAFRANPNLLPLDTTTPIVLVDDVITTCATVIAATQALHVCGFHNIRVWALARTP